MKKHLLASLLVLVSLVLSVVADEELPDPGVTPDSMLYGLDRAFERISLALTFDRAAKAEKRLQIASERISELKAMVDKGKPEFVEKLKEDYEEELNEAESDMEAARALGKNVTLLAEHVANATSKHIAVLERVLDKVPDQAKSAILHAINVSQRGHQRAVENILKEKGDSENKTDSDLENATRGKPENKTTGKPENSTHGKPENVTGGKPENQTKGKPENITKGKPDNNTRGKPDGTPKGKPEDKATGKPL